MRAWSGSLLTLTLLSVPRLARTYPFVIKNFAGGSDPFRVQKAAVAGGLLAPCVFNVGGTQYAAALYQDGFTFVGRDGLIAGVPFRAARPGDIIALYGIGSAMWSRPFRPARSCPPRTTSPA